MRLANVDKQVDASSPRRGTIRRASTRKGRGLLFLLLPLILSPSSFILSASAAPTLILQSDFGTKDGAVAAMKGVAVGVNPELKIYDLTHEIPAYNIWEGAYRLWQTAPYWPAGTVFVSVVDPGVGTARKSVVAHTKNGQYFVTPDNGTLTLIAEHLGIDAVREIDEKVNRRPGSEDSYTFHGRDVYAYTGARLAAGVIKFAEVGPELDPTKLLSIAHAKAQVDEKGTYIVGGIPVLDPQYGNVWTDIGQADFEKLQPAPKPGDRFWVTATHLSKAYLDTLKKPDGASWRGPTGNAVWFLPAVPYVKTFGDVPVGQPLLYVNSLGNLALALNEGDFASTHSTGSGPEWQIDVRRAEAPAVNP